MEIRDIRYFKTVAAHLNLGRAANTLGLSTTALSKSLRRLEKSVGAKLVKRTTKGVELTPAGGALFAQAGRLQRVLDDIRHEAADLGAGRAGHISIGASSGLSEHCVSDAYAALLKEAPDVSLKTLVVDGGQLTPALRNGLVDFVVNRMTPRTPADFVCEELFRDQRVVYVATSHPLAKRKRVSLTDLTGERWASNIDAVSWNMLCQDFEAHKLTPPKLFLESNSVEMRLRAVESSNMVMHSSSELALRVKRRYRIAALRVDGMHLERRLGIIYRKDGYLPPAARRMIDILKKQGRQITERRW